MDLQTLRRRARALQCLRRHFTSTGYLEVDTPLLAPHLIPEGNLEVFSTRYSPAAADAAPPPRPLYLIPSPELWMKRLLCAGSGSIFQICRCFRNHEPLTPLHAPEFTMLEWYTVGAGYEENIRVQEELVEALRRELAVDPGFDLRPPFQRLSLPEAFRRHLGLELERLQEPQELARQARRLGLSVTPLDSWADLFHKLFLTFVEPALPRRPVILLDYPAAVPTLARRKAGTPWAERWELYIAGLEVSNCYTEETDAAAVRAFFAAQTQAKAAALEPHPVDWELAEEIGRSLPACSGAALGVDRLLAVLLGAAGVGDVSPFSLGGGRTGHGDPPDRGPA